MLLHFSLSLPVRLQANDVLVVHVLIQGGGAAACRLPNLSIINPMKRIRVLVADDSALMRRTLRHVIESDPEFELVGAARDGEDVVQKARELRPDVISMDINMPKLDGVTALQMIVQENICPVVMLSSLTQKGAVTTFECLELGAFDYVGKPDGTVRLRLLVLPGATVKRPCTTSWSCLPSVAKLIGSRLNFASVTLLV